MATNSRARNDNVIHPTARIAENVVIGRYNTIGPNVLIAGFKGADGGIVRIGDCNVIHDNTRILAGSGDISIGDWNVLHNTMLVMGGLGLEIGHNCWLGQNTILDGAGGLRLGNGVRVGMYSQLWTHVASGELIEGCTLFAHRPTILENDVWLVGSCIVGSGVTLGRRSVCLIGSNVTKSTEADRVYAGSPAKIMEGMSAYRSILPKERLTMMRAWLERFMVESGDESLQLSGDHEELALANKEERLIFHITARKGLTESATTYFDLVDKTYTKRLTTLERQVYQFLYDHKARFIPRS